MHWWSSGSDLKLILKLNRIVGSIPVAHQLIYLFEPMTYIHTYNINCHTSNVTFR